MLTNEQRIAAMRQQLTDALAPTQLEIIDESHKHIGHAGAASGAGHFKVTITSAAFTGKSLIEQQRLVHSALNNLLKTDIHALRLKTLVP